MATNQLGIRNSNIIVPYTAATKRSKQVDITFTGSNLATILMAKAIFYADSAGAWRMRFNIAYTATATAVSETITLTNISTAGLAASQVFSATNSTAAQSVLYSAVNAASPAVMLVVFSATTSSTREFSGDIALAAEPTTYTTAANMEGVLPVDVYIPPATDTSSGLINFYKEDDTTLASVAWKPDGAGSGIGTAFAAKITRSGRVVTLSLAGNTTADPAGSTYALTLKTSSDAAVTLPTWARPLVAQEILVYGLDTTVKPLIFNVTTGGVINLYLPGGSSTLGNGTNVAGMYSGSVSYNI